MEKQLIENALALCGKTTRYVYEYPEIDNDNISIEKFCYYLLSPEFIEKYKNIEPYCYPFAVWHYFWQAIYEYQSWNEKPLIELLTKIKWQ